MTSSTRVVFLLGAGASVPAGLPALNQLTNDVLTELKSLSASQDTQHALYATIRDQRPVLGGRPRNVEDILAILDGLITAQVPALGSSLRDFALLEYETRAAIWRILNRHESLKYLDPLARLLEQWHHLDIFTLNNDRVIETWCEGQRIPCYTGFDRNGHWTSTAFNQDFGVRLFKIHGSIDWAHRPGQPLRQLNLREVTRNPDGIPVFRSPLGDLALVFPSANKVVAQAPLVDLLVHFRHTLLESSVLVVIGCNLGDEHMRGAILDSLAANERLRVLIVSPTPFTIANRLAQRKQPSEVKHRVDFLPLGIEAALQGPLQQSLAHAHQGELSPYARIRLVIRNLPAAWAIEESRQLATSLGGANATILKDVVQNETQTRDMPGPRQDLYQDLHNIADSPSALASRLALPQNVGQSRSRAAPASIPRKGSYLS